MLLCSISDAKIVFEINKDLPAYLDKLRLIELSVETDLCLSIP